MERDFLGISGKDTVKEEPKGSRQDSGFYGGSPVHWPFANKNYSLQHFMLFKAAQEERSKKTAHDQLSSGFHPLSTIDAFDANHKSSPLGSPQKSVHQFAMQSYQSQNNESFSATKHYASEIRTLPVASNHSIPIATSSPFFKFHGSPNVPNMAASPLKQQPFSGGGMAANLPVLGSTVGASNPRNLPKPSPTTAQLTIFYAGSVNVYDDIPLDKAQAIMFLANSGSVSTSSNLNPRPKTPSPVHSKATGVDGVTMIQTPTQTPKQVTPSCSGLSSPISITSQHGTHSRNGSSKTDDVAAEKTVGVTAPTGQQHEVSKTVTTSICPTSTVTLMPRAVPQARKASLVRFLEKRKERVTSAMPYSSAKKLADDALGRDGASSTTKASSPDVALSSNMERSWHVGQQKNSADSGESLSTKLEI